jgi:hypothetical protein
MRLEPINGNHPDVVALLSGPLVLFAITDDGSRTKLTRAQLLAASQTEDQLWEIRSASDSYKFKPYVAIDDEHYSTYLRVT